MQLASAGMRLNVAWINCRTQTERASLICLGDPSPHPPKPRRATLALRKATNDTTLCHRAFQWLWDALLLPLG